MTKTDLIIDAFQLCISIGQIFTKGDINAAAQKKVPEISSATVGWTISNELENTGRIEKIGTGTDGANLYKRKW